MLFRSHVTARIESVSASFKDSYITASCTYSINTMATRVKNPFLKLIICREGIDGARHLVQNYANSAVNRWMLSTFRVSAETSSKQQTEVASSLLRRITISGNASGSNWVDKRDKVIAVRAELWFDGAMLCNKSPQTKSDLAQLGLQEDWYVCGKFPDKIVYPMKDGDPWR